MLGAVMGLIMVAVVAVGGLVAYRVLAKDDGDGGSDRTGAASAASDASSSTTGTYSPPPTPTTPTALPTASASPSASPSASASTSASPTAADTGPGSSTLVDALQAAAERAVAGNAQASLVALNMKNGEIVATVHRATGMSGARAPGSTFKIVSSALLLKNGVVTPNAKVPCPKQAVAGKTWENQGGFEIPNATFREDFARSCNTAFVNLRSKIGDAELSQFSKDYFGLNSDAWQVGEGGTTDGIVPPSAGDADKAAQMIGQGSLEMNPMTMASVVATAVTGQFRQPILVRGGETYKASKPLPANVSRDLKDMMRACATSGTAKSTFTGMSGVGAKTGTAEVGGGSNDGWMVAYRGDIAVAVVVLGGGSGSGAAGPIVRGFLEAVPA